MLAAEGAKLALADINADKVKQTADKVKAMGGEALWFQVDVTSRTKWSKRSSRPWSRWATSTSWCTSPAG